MPLQISFAHQFYQQQQETYCLFFSGDGKRLFSPNSSTLLWRLKDDGNWEYECSLPVGANVLSFDYEVVWYVEEKLIKLVSFDGSKEIATIPRPSARYWAFSPDWRWFISNEQRETLRLWDITSQQSFSIPIPFPPRDQNGENTDMLGERVGDFLFTPDCQQIVLFADSPEGSLHICSFEPEYKRLTLQKTLPGMIEGEISPDGKLLAIILSNNQPFDYKEDIYLYDLVSLRLIHVFQQATRMERYNLLAFSPDSRYLASSKTDGWVDIFSLDSFECVAQFAAHPGLSSHATDPIGGLA